MSEVYAIRVIATAGSTYMYICMFLHLTSDCKNGAFLKMSLQVSARIFGVIILCMYILVLFGRVHIYLWCIISICSYLYVYRILCVLVFFRVRRSCFHRRLVQGCVWLSVIRTRLCAFISR